MTEFTYKGEPIYKLKSVGQIRDLDEQMDEIQNRLVALRDWCVEDGLIMTNLHIKNALGLNNNMFDIYRRGVVRESADNTKMVKVEEASRVDKETARKIRERANLLVQWCEYARQWCLDSVAHDAIPSRSIYISKAIFHNWDTPQDKKSNNIGIELLVSKAKEAKK